MEAPTKSLEFGVGFGYNQPFGNIRRALRFRDIAAAGAQAEFDIGYRFNPEFSMSFYATGSRYGASSGVAEGTEPWGASAGVQGAYHFRPLRGLDPWVQVGGGWRGYWERFPVGTTSLQGLELARAVVGLDVRMTSQIAVSPMIGADLSMFLTESPAGEGTRLIPGRLNTFVFAGVGGRFDFGPTTPTLTPAPTLTGSR
jgi:hypothetical protein